MRARKRRTINVLGEGGKGNTRKRKKRKFPVVNDFEEGGGKTAKNPSLREDQQRTEMVSARQEIRKGAFRLRWKRLQAVKNAKILLADGAQQQTIQAAKGGTIISNRDERDPRPVRGSMGRHGEDPGGGGLFFFGCWFFFLVLRRRKEEHSKSLLR